MWATGKMQCCQQRITLPTVKCRLALVLVLGVIGSFVSGDSPSGYGKCGVDINTRGFTVPNGDIKVLNGTPLEIYCTLLENLAAGLNASDLYFQENSEVVSSEYTQIVNETTLRLYIPEPSPSSNMYYCKLHKQSKGSEKKSLDEAVCLNQVYVGFAPKDVENFSCVSNNWEDLNCTWEVPNHFVPTTYKLQSFVAGTPRKCPGNTTVNNYCYWSSATVPHYRQVEDNCTFRLHAENVFGKKIFTHTIHQWAYVIPKPPVNLTFLETTTHSALLAWSVAYPMDNFEKGLSVKIEYRSDHDSINSWMLADTSNLKIMKNARFNLTGLKYASTPYEVRVYMKSSVAVDDNHWSKSANIVIRTNSTIPGAPPKTDIGSFEINRESRVVYVYWQYIDSSLKNGDKFEYKVIDIEENGFQKQLSPVEVTNAYAKFANLSKGSYSFTVVSRNIVGRSAESSKVIVPSEYEMPPQPIDFTKIAFQNGTFELSWKPPAKVSFIKDYTLFWCENEQDRPYQCTGFLNWTHVPKTETVKLLPMPNNGSTYQFAIAANSETGSSGMVWASCTVIHNHGVSKMKNFYIRNVNATSLELVWHLDCSERNGAVGGFRVYYCPLLSPTKSQCIGEEKYDTVADSPQVEGNYVLRNLKPYTTYMISIAVINSKLVEGPRSDYKYHTTTESAPEPVQNLTVSKVTNSSMVVSWTPPATKNGKIKYYDISYNGRVQIVDNNRPDGVNETILVDLIPFVNYTISIAACTVNCSNVTRVIMQTKIGNPGEIEAPKVSITNTSLARVSWDPPQVPGGLVDMYTVRFTSEHDSLSPTYRNTTDTELEVPISCANEGWGKKYLFSVQALNRDGGLWYLGPWSVNGEGNCVSSEMSGALIAFISLCGIMAMVAGCFGAFYAARRVWGHYNEMRHVKVTLPPGLTSVNVYCPTSYSY